MTNNEFDVLLKNYEKNGEYSTSGLLLAWIQSNVLYPEIPGSGLPARGDAWFLEDI